MPEAPLVLNVGYRTVSLPDFVEPPFEPGQPFDMTEAARELHGSDALIAALVGGLGSAKTYTLAHEAGFLGFSNLGCVGIVVEPRHNDHLETFIPALELMLEESGLEPGRDWVHLEQKGMVHVLGGRGRGGFSLYLRSGDHPERIVGTNAAFALIDEPARMKREVLDRCIQRVRDHRAGRKAIRLFGTPDPGSWFAKFAANPDLPDVHVVRARTLDNPFQNNAYVALVRATMSSLMAEAMLEGKSVSLAGTAYRCFKGENWNPNDREISGNLRQLSYDSDLPLVLCVDNNHMPLAACLAQEVRGDLCQFDEVSIHGGWWEGLANAVFAKCNGKAPPAIVLAGDPYLRQQVSDKPNDWGVFGAIQAALEKLFPTTRFEIECAKGAPAVVTRLECHNALLCNAEGKRRLFVDPRCRETILDYQEVQCDADGGILKTGPGADKMRTHWSDAIGYFIAQRYPLEASIWRPDPVIVSMDLHGRS